MKYLCIFSGISVLVSLINPNTYKAFLYIFITHSSQTLYASLAEYKAPYSIDSFTLYPELIYSFWVYFFISIVLIIIFIKQRNISPLLLLIFSIIPPLIGLKYIPVFAIVATAMFRHVPVNITSRISTKTGSVINTLLIVSFLVLIFIANPLKNTGIYKIDNDPFHPVNASEFLIKNNISGNIFCSYNTSAYLLLRLFPQSKIYSDARYISEERVKTTYKIQGEFDSFKENIENINRLIPGNIGTIRVDFTDAQAKKVENTQQSPDNFTRNQSWKELLDEIGADIIIYEAVNYYSGTIYPFIFKLIQEESWKLIYSDGTVLIFVRDKEKFKDIIAQYNLPKTTVYNEIFKESRICLNKNISYFYSSAALALLLKGAAHDNTLYFIEKALSLDPHNIYAVYCNTLYVLMTRKQ